MHYHMHYYFHMHFHMHVHMHYYFHMLLRLAARATSSSLRANKDLAVTGGGGVMRGAAKVTGRGRCAAGRLKDTLMTRG